MDDNGIGRTLPSAAAAAANGAGTGGLQNRQNSWFEALAGAWGQALDDQAGRIQILSDQIGAQGIDAPSTLVQLTAESLRMQYMSNSESTSVNAVGQALETMARKQ